MLKELRVSRSFIVSAPSEVITRYYAHTVKRLANVQSTILDP